MRTSKKIKKNFIAEILRQLDIEMILSAYYRNDTNGT